MSVILTGADDWHEGWLAGIFELDPPGPDACKAYVDGRTDGAAEQWEEPLRTKLQAAIAGGDVLIVEIEFEIPR